MPKHAWPSFFKIYLTIVLTCSVYSDPAKACVPAWINEDRFAHELRLCQSQRSECDIDWSPRDIDIIVGRDTAKHTAAFCSIYIGSLLWLKGHGGVCAIAADRWLPRFAAAAQARVALDCGTCPPEAFWNSKYGKNLSRGVAASSSKAWQQLTKQCRPEPEEPLQSCSDLLSTANGAYEGCVRQKCSARGGIERQNTSADFCGDGPRMVRGVIEHPSYARCASEGNELLRKFDLLEDLHYDETSVQGGWNYIPNFMLDRGGRRAVDNFITAAIETQILSDLEDSYLSYQCETPLNTRQEQERLGGGLLVVTAIEIREDGARFHRGTFVQGYYPTFDAGVRGHDAEPVSGSVRIGAPRGSRIDYRYHWIPSRIEE